jgi:hypothetical protein
MRHAIVPNEYRYLFANISVPTVLRDTSGKELGLLLPPDFDLPNGRSVDDLQRELLNSRGRPVEEVWNTFNAVDR